jgi:hypothetical protein
MNSDKEREVQAAKAAIRQSSRLEVLEGGVAWLKPKLIRDLPPVKTLNPADIPQAFRELIEDVAERMQVPLDYPFAAQVVSTSAAIGRRVRVQPKVYDTLYAVIPNLWGVLIGLSGSKKSPVVNLITDPLRVQEAQWRAEYENAQQEYETEKDQFEAELAAWKKNGRHGPCPEKPEAPKQKRLLVNDATFEKVHAVMAENPAGIFLNRDELSGWLGMLDRPERAGERAFYLTAWGGHEPYDLGRISRGDIYVPHCCASLLGTGVPDRLKSYLVNRESRPAEANDGLLQRLQILVWPDVVSQYRHVDCTPKGNVMASVARIYKQVLALDAECPALYKFARDAQPLYVDWDTELQNKKVRNPDTHAELRSHLSKYDKLLAALAVQFEIADRVVAKRDIGPDKVRLISREHLEQAIRVCAYLESHARRAYFCVQSPAIAAAWELAEKIRQRKLKERFAAADVYRKGWARLGSPEGVQQALNILMDCNWLVPEFSKDEKRERYGVRYRINPRIYE